MLTLVVANTGDRPIQVGSHFHFAEANPALRFDRDRAWGHRLDVPAGTAVRFEPGVEREVALVPLAGAAWCQGCAGRFAGRQVRRPSDAAGPAWSGSERAEPVERLRRAYGPTAGDRIRLADTDLLIEVERGPLRRPGRPGTRRCSAAAR